MLAYERSCITVEDVCEMPKKRNYEVLNELFNGNWL